MFQLSSKHQETHGKVIGGASHPPARAGAWQPLKLSVGKQREVLGSGLQEQPSPTPALQGPGGRAGPRFPKLSHQDMSFQLRSSSAWGRTQLLEV